jgi:hypothetical protein
MNRKYVIITGTDQMAELAFNCIYTDKGAADAVADDMRTRLVETRMSRPLAGEGDRSIAEAAAKSFIKVYELVATDFDRSAQAADTELFMDEHETVAQFVARGGTPPEPMDFTKSWT